MLNKKAKILAIPVGAALVLGGAFLVTPAMAATVSASSVHPNMDRTAAKLPSAVSSKYSADSERATLTPNLADPAPTTTTLPVAAQEAPEAEAPKVEAPEMETPEVEAPEVEAPKVEAPKVEEPKVEAPKVEAPKVEAPKVEAPEDQKSSANQSAPTEVSNGNDSNSGD